MHRKRIILSNADEGVEYLYPSNHNWWECKTLWALRTMAWKSYKVKHAYKHISCCCSVDQSSCPTLWPHGTQHNRLPWPSLSPGVCSNSCPLSQWCYPIISSFVAPFSSYFQSFPPSGSFPMNPLFILDGQNIGASASTSVLPMHI